MNEKDIQAARAAKAKYYREYRKKNPEKHKLINDRYWAKRAKRELEQKQQEPEQNAG